MTEKLRGELKKLRSDALEAEMLHQQALGDVMEQHLLEISARRADVDAGLSRYESIMQKIWNCKISHDKKR